MSSSAPSAAVPGAFASSTPPSDTIRRRELADFLRSRRERITPERVGLPRGPRRRTPGLRREEVAQLAAVGVTWYTWLEQARDIHVSPQVLDAIARALELDKNERSHLFVLAGQMDPVPGTECPGVSAPVRLMLDRLEPFPACVMNSRYDVVAYNGAYRHLVVDLDELPFEDRNVMWLAFTHPAWREALVDRAETVRVMAAKFRTAMAEHLAEPTWKCLVKRLLSESAEFRELWARHDVVMPDNRAKCFLNREVGRLNFDHTSLWLGPQAGPRLVTYVPSDEETRRRLERLLESARERASAAGRGEAPGPGGTGEPALTGSVAGDHEEAWA
ncbi:helix-turn-helix transcriptional regulator [Wenjunlia tyrosinilytica]|uniref:DNA-binding protein n=1 Tax=Wenjunlia tyrosinilytica TaxID=1544741 RepID=A0A918DSU7_9ACTN|nr:helix-turn-helix transcriptional regulator [Wenjunlia tyrosinilytica]GGO80669.1 DNA-binding protein [Wenjunlia tyrosinilytica]